MFKKITKKLAFFAILLLLFSYGQEKVFATDGEAEPNNSIQTATPISVNKDYTGVLQDYNDRQDYYKFSLSKAGNITFEMEQIVGKSWSIEIQDKDGNDYSDTYTSYDSYANGKTAIEVGLPAGEFFIKISNNSSSYGTPYKFNVKFTASDFYEKEFNNTIQTASKVYVNNTYKGVLQSLSSYTSDKDYYTFTLSKAGNIKVKMDRQVGSSWNIYIKDKDGNNYAGVHTEYGSYANGEETVEVGLPAGTYYIYLANHSSTTNVPYEFDLVYTQSENYEKEYNNSIQTATQINVNQDYHGVLQDGTSNNEVDFYKFKLNKAGNITYTMDQKVGSSWYVSIIDKNGNVYDRFNTSYGEYATGQSKSNIGLPAGEYFIKINNYSSSYRVPYKFQVKYVAGENYEKEFNEGISTATPIKLNSEYQGTIQSSDTDYYKFTLNKSESLSLIMKRIVDSSWRVQILDGNGKSYTSFSTEYGQYATGNEVVNIGLSSGTYYIKIINYSNSYQEPYKFKLQKQTDRINGVNRYETAIKISQMGWKTANTVVLAKGSDFPDALAGGPLAYYHNAPILLTSDKSLTPATKKEIQRLKAKKVIILGSAGAISNNVEKEIKNMGISVQRIGGKDRYQTAALIAKQIPSKKIVIANGVNFPDALAVAPYAARNQIPILLTKPTSLPDATKAQLAGKTSSIVVGSKTVVSNEIMKQLPKPVRYGGADRYETGKLINENLKLGTNVGYVVTGLNFPDALAGSVLAAKQNAPILLVRNNRMPSPTASQLAKYDSFTIWGGAGAVNKSVEDTLNSKLNTLK
ncbi:cell wall-binding repeat-containing protein [Bacillus timonensis]|uniref:cell wall-binding repeat-containing protein n=1 Tax=Bacillus timonensis TaxID=1033734 RepID=UPI00028A326E|nr:cell wall-binding repeat-containing protein [Bacillus timonensis]